MRVGVHTGTPLIGEEGYVGHDVHRAARIAAAGHGGQVLVSAATEALVALELSDLGEHRFKDLGAPERVFQLGSSEFPALKSLYRTNLPVPATTFVGRGHELDELGALLDRGVSLLTLTGLASRQDPPCAAGGCGRRGRLPDGVWWVPLASVRDPDLLLSSVALALGVPEQRGRQLEESLIDVLSGGSSMLLLDNIEHLLPRAAAHVATLRDAGGSTVVVTSRERLQLAGEHVYPVAPLVATEATELFSARTAALGTTPVMPIRSPSSAPGSTTSRWQSSSRRLGPVFSHRPRFSRDLAAASTSSRAAATPTRARRRSAQRSGGPTTCSTGTSRSCSRGSRSSRAVGPSRRSRRCAKPTSTCWPRCSTRAWCEERRAGVDARDDP